MTKTRNRTIMMILFMPVIVFVWMLGWTLFSLEPKKKPTKIRPREKTQDTLTLRVLPQEEITVEE